MSSFVGKKFPNLAVLLNDMGDTFQVNVLEEQPKTIKKYSYFGTQRILHTYVQQNTCFSRSFTRI